MPAAASASRTRSRRSPRSRPRGPSAAGPAAGRVRWDRVGRVAMLCVLAALAYLYLSAGVHMFSTWRQASHDSAAVAAMSREHAQLLAQHERLSKQETVEDEARKLGMIKAGERPYLVTGLPGN